MRKWIMGILVVLSLLMWFGVVWFALPLVGFGESHPFEKVWVRILMISVVWLTVGLIYLIKFIRRRRSSKALEEALMEPEVTGDGEVLNDKMGEALAVLRESSGSKAFLYDLPWYVIIGPPGSGKTTALLNSGIKFPLAEKGEGAVAGVGGTRYCDWWFSEEAVMIDTAGRYTTQDSDAEADGKSWNSFLKLLKTHRANQPINGVILAISLQEIMTASPAEIEGHAEIIRNRLMEINDELRVDFPVYVLFTKADLISGFMEFFGSFSASRRQKVWGHTFQTASKKEQTVEQFDVEYDALVNRLSEEVTDRLQEEHDGINRIAIFGFPGQVAMLKERLGGFMKGVFGHTRYKVAANLRGFYFSSGTQEGTPIDQVLGAMQRNFAMGQGAMSGKGKSFFLTDLLRKVIFAEAGWVSTDRRAVRRQAIFRYGTMTAITLATMGMIGLWGMSYFQNKQLINTADAAVSDYELSAQEELTSGKVEDIDLLQILPHLEMLRNMPMGYADEQTDTPLSERFGLSQRGSLRSAATVTYRQALERMFRSRLILQLELQLESFIRAGEVLAVYRTLKVYKLLGDLAPKSDDELIRAYFREDWRSNTYQGTNVETREVLEQHLVAMLELDSAQEPSFELNGALIDQAERTLARMKVDEQAYSLLLSTAEFAGIEQFSVANRAGRDAELVLETIDGRPLDDMIISPLYTYRGFHDFFLPQLAEIAQTLIDDQWVLGDYAAEAQIEDQVKNVGPVLLSRYTDDWINEWDSVLGNLKLRPMSADRPSYQALAALSAPRSSPVLLLIESIREETRLTAAYEEGNEGDLLGGNGGAAAELGSEVAGVVGAQGAQLLISRTRGLTRIGLDAAFKKGRAQAGATGNSSSGSSRTILPGQEIENHFRDWHELLEGEINTRIIDQLLGTMGDMQRVLIISTSSPELADQEMPIKLGALKQAASRLPRDLGRMVQEAVDDFEGDAANTNLARLNEMLNTQVSQVCEAAITNKFPFVKDSSRDVAMTDFSKIFAPNGVMDRFFLAELSPHANVSGLNWTWKDTGPLAGKLSNQTLKQFQRAAAIRDAYFSTGGGIPSVQMQVRPASFHAAIDTAVLAVNGQLVQTRAKGNNPANLDWPGTTAGGSVTLTFTPEMKGRKSTMSEGGSWAFLRFLNKGSPQVSGNVMQVRYTISGRHVAYKIELGTETNPFFMKELRDFRCPNGL
ncbi:type VI secretion system membrane subunit TssM [Alphaproteobacteria bacterium KMM 3653]|uniref:Type VI secretion system membrane subunit TssM n=1 Tax=Harenicola maris TaxID=2841044 RepID=A0AAP2CQA1_9RHOB|nr:type VI secretion system membrane subunit TssM [Harenicola maris]